ncbi:MAG: O-antigen ligase family protein [Candidatus Krumholzibacteriota bacterium]|nr:O-antigen ligase family protein [Candidatus Krumholzibacteriota bacterium]
MFLIILIVCAGIAVFAIFNQKAIIGRFSLESASIGFRLAGYKLTIKKMAASGKYLFGNGPASISQIVSFGYNTRWYPHNILLELLYEVGLLGMIIYFIPIFYAVGSTIKQQKTWIFFAVVLFFLFAQTSGDLVANNFFPIYLSLYFVSRIKKEDPHDYKLVY